MAKKTIFTNKSGGARKNCGRKPLPPDQKKVAVRFYLTVEQAEKVKAFVEELLSK